LRNGLERGFVADDDGLPPGELDAPVRLGHVLGEVHREAEEVVLVDAQHAVAARVPDEVAPPEAAVAAGLYGRPLGPGEVQDGADVAAPLRLGEGAAAVAERIARVEVLGARVGARAGRVAE